MNRTTRAVLVANGFALIPFLAFHLALAGTGPIRSVSGSVVLLFVFITIYFPALAMLAAPTNNVVWHKRLLSWWPNTAIPSILIGLFISVSAGLPNPITAWIFYIGYVVPCASFAAVGGLAYWWIAVRRSNYGGIHET